MPKEGSIKIVNLMTPGAGILVLGYIAIYKSYIQNAVYVYISSIILGIYRKMISWPLGGCISLILCMILMTGINIQFIDCYYVKEL